MNNNTIADFLIRIKNGFMASKTQVTAPYSKITLSLAKILHDSGYLNKVEITGADKKKNIILTLSYQNKKAKLNNIQLQSRPSGRIYVKKNGIPHVLGGMGMAILSTPQGLMTDRQARKKGLGGEVICKVW